MFKRATIELTGPICDCEIQNLGWDIGNEGVGKPTLEIICKTCKTRLTVSNEKFRATFILDQSYPGKKPAATVLKLVPKTDA